MSKAFEITFQQGMQKDIDKSLMSNKTYIDATNVRLITTEGSTTGSLENIRGMRSIHTILDNTTVLVDTNTYFVVQGSIIYNGTTYNKGVSFICTAPVLSFTGSGKIINITNNTSCILSGQSIIGSCELRDSIILFTTNTTIAAPETQAGRRNCIYKLVVDINPTVESQTSLTLLYDDNLNDSGGYLDFSTYYPIKAIGRYETSIIQKIYWTDGYNNIRYANIAENLTNNGEAYNGITVHYFSVDKFEFQPHIDLVKPVLYSMTSGSLKPGSVQYAYQLYKLNGAETTISPLSDIIHITESSDTLSSTALGYYGTENTGESTGKGCKIQIVNTTIGFNRVRLYRVYYSVLDATPTISIVNELYTNPAGETLYIVDSGNELTQVTIDEFNIASTELFIAQDIGVKDNILFAANIEDNSFDINDFDCRAVRFKRYNVHTGTVSVSADYEHGEPGISITYGGLNDRINVTLTNFDTKMGVAAPDYINSVETVSWDDAGICVDGTYTDSIGPGVVFNSMWDVTSVVAGPTYSSAAGGTVTFTLARSSDYFVDYVSGPNTCTLHSFSFTYTWYEDIIQAIVEDDTLPDVTINKPALDTYAGWTTAGWDVTDLSSTYPINHDGVNIFNDPTNDYNDDAAYKYQIDGSTLGAEGPNIKIGFTLEDITLNTTTSSRYYDSPNGNTIGSYYNMANPYLSGKRSWQRDEVYRLYVVFYNEHGQSSWPSWICDLKFPSLKDTGYELTSISTDTVTGKVLYPTVEFKHFPSTATSAQIYVVPRDTDDKSILTQCLTIPTDENGGIDYPVLITTALDTRDIVKLISPEILIQRDITNKGNNYLDFVGRYNNNTDNDTSTLANVFGYYKLRNFDPCTKGVNNETDIISSVFFTPSDDEITVGSFTFRNSDTVTNHCFSGSGLVVEYDNSSWTPRGLTYNVVNYRQNVFISQYGGNTYEARTKNYCRPCSNIITSTGVAHTCYNGDTFISYFQYLDSISDLARDCSPAVHDSWGSVIYVPLESSINCDLRHDKCIKDQYNVTTHYLMQEIAGEWIDNNGSGDTYNQPTDLYLYNSVYSQESNLDYRYCKPVDYNIVNTFDCRIKASVEKVNGEISDNWTKFGINEYIDVDSSFGAINAIKNVNDLMFYWQDKAFGSLSINERSLITDNNASQLVLGTGGILDRYTYISDRVGCKDKFSIVRGKQGVYWYDRVNNILQTYTDRVDAFSRSKGIQSYLDSNYISTVKVISAYDLENDEILYTFINSGVTNSFCLAYNELIGVFVSRYTFIPTLYIPFNNKLLSTTTSTFCKSLFNLNRIFIHNSLYSSTKRCYFYGLGEEEQDMFEDSTIKILFNPEYNTTKVFDNLYFITNLYNNLGVEVYDVSFDHIRCYNDYQNSDYITLSLYNNIVRRERMWNMAVPRNVISVDTNLYPDIFDSNNFNINRIYKERLRDRYMISDFRFINNGLNDKFVFNKIGCTYRTSMR